MSSEPRLAFESIAGQRPYQEDAVLAETLPDGRILVAVADGMGGHAAGEVASAIALETLKEAVEEGQTLAEAFTLANARVFERAREPGKQGMGTTLVAALIEDGEVNWANVGDSRGYVISGDGIHRETEDHSFVAEAVKRGQSEAEAMAGPWKDALTRSIGTEEEVDVDVFGPMRVDGDCAFLVCSDGLYKTLSDQDVLRIYHESGGPRGAAQSLVTTAFESGSDDNISVAIAEFGEVNRVVQGGTMPLDFVITDEDAAEADEIAAGARAREGSESEGDGEDPDIAEPGEGSAEVDPDFAAEQRTYEAHAPPEDAESSGLPLGAIAVVVAIVGALVAFLVFGG